MMMRAVSLYCHDTENFMQIVTINHAICKYIDDRCTYMIRANY